MLSNCLILRNISFTKDSQGCGVESDLLPANPPPWAAAFNGVQILWFGSVENVHSHAPVAFNQRTVPNIAAIAGFWEGRWAQLTWVLMLWVDEWQNHSLSSEVGTGWASAATASRPKNNWIEMASGSFLLRTEAVPSQLKALHNNQYHCQGLAMRLRSLPSSETDEYLWPVFTQLLLQLMGQTGSAGPAAVRQSSSVSLGLFQSWSFSHAFISHVAYCGKVAFKLSYLTLLNVFFPV